jgi:hypothetical protein
MKNPEALQFLVQSDAPGTYYHTLFKGTSIFCLVQSPSEWYTYIIHVSIVSRLKNHSLSCLLPFIYTDLKWIYQVTSIRNHSFHLDSPGQSVMARAGVLNVLYTQYMYYKDSHVTDILKLCYCFVK